MFGTKQHLFSQPQGGLPDFGSSQGATRWCVGRFSLGTTDLRFDGSVGPRRGLRRTVRVLGDVVAAWRSSAGVGARLIPGRCGYPVVPPRGGAGLVVNNRLRLDKDPSGEYRALLWRIL
jgi:hypothetical protein